MPNTRQTRPRSSRPVKPSANSSRLAGLATPRSRGAQQARLHLHRSRHLHRLLHGGRPLRCFGPSSESRCGMPVGVACNGRGELEIIPIRHKLMARPRLEVAEVAKASARGRGRPRRTAVRLRHGCCPRRPSRKDPQIVPLPNFQGDRRPQACVIAAIVLLIDVAREISLQNRRTDVVADQEANRELALLLVTRNRLVQIG